MVQGERPVMEGFEFLVAIPAPEDLNRAYAHSEPTPWESGSSPPALHAAANSTSTVMAAFQRTLNNITKQQKGLITTSPAH